jgi:tetratricopeptide (TPR) repeat protein
MNLKSFGKFSSGMLRITFLAGCILFVLTLFVLIFLRVSVHSSAAEKETGFLHDLREYDRLSSLDPQELDKELDKLEKKAIGVEAWLSVLKRRREISRKHQTFFENYRKSLERACKAYPWSQPIAALTAASLINNTAINREIEQKLRELLPLFTDFSDLRLSLNVLLGDFHTPLRAMELTQLPGYWKYNNEDIDIDLAILKILRGASAAADIQTALLAEEPSENFLRFAAEYYYDFGSLIKSAELFSLIEGDSALLRQADALYLADLTDNARQLWLITADNEESLYNLAVTSDNKDEYASFLEKLVSAHPESKTKCREAGLIRYSRLLSETQAIQALENTKMKPDDYPFIDLEIHKRKCAGWETGRQLAQTWLLLDKHPRNRDLYLWAAWFMFLQRYYGEAEILFSRAQQEQIGGLSLYQAILQMQEGSLDSASKLFRSLISNQDNDYEIWAAYANLGRILEYERSPALEQYELAAVHVKNNAEASRIQYNIARCHTIAGRTLEARRVLEYALDLDPENYLAKLELGRTR